MGDRPQLNTECRMGIIPGTRYHFSYFLFPRGTTLRSNRNVSPDFLGVHVLTNVAGEVDAERYFALIKYDVPDLL